MLSVHRPDSASTTQVWSSGAALQKAHRRTSATFSALRAVGRQRHTPVQPRSSPISHWMKLWASACGASVTLWYLNYNTVLPRGNGISRCRRGIPL